MIILHAITDVITTSINTCKHFKHH